MQLQKTVPNLIHKRRERGNARADPFLLVGLPFVVDDVGAQRRHFDPHDKVRRVTRGGERASPGQNLVHRATIYIGSDLGAVLLGTQVDHRQLRVQLFRQRVADRALRGVPARTFQKQTTNVHTILWPGFQLRPILSAEDEVEVHRVDWVLVLTREVLQRSRQERLWEVESRDPEHRRHSGINPVLNELQAVHEISDPRTERFHRRIGHASPAAGHLVDRNAVADGFQLVGHHDESLEGLQQLRQSELHGFDELVIANAFLQKYGVHGLLVHHRVQQRHTFDVELTSLLDVLEDTRRGHFDELFTCASPCSTATIAGLQRQADVKHVEGFRVGTGDQCILVHAENSR
mmetsp:Transcript_33419/g.57252  ORF Transcript_33419/g.57252 Transcript_33419/m.57252 type:complete len:347 (-) Transcript_33419:1041-2081(-)